MSVANLKNLGVCGICRGSILVDARATEEEQYRDIIVCDPKCKKLLWERKCAEEKDSFQQSCSDTRCGQVLSVQSESSNLKIIKLFAKLIMFGLVVWLILLYICPSVVGVLAKLGLFFFYADSSLPISAITTYHFKLHTSEQSWGITETTPKALASLASIFKAMETPHYIYNSVGLYPSCIFEHEHIKMGRRYTAWLVIIFGTVSTIALYLYISYLTINYCCPFLTRPCRRRTRSVAIKRFKTK